MPTVREIAGRLGVSAFTVQQVFNKLREEGRIRSRAGEGTFLVATASKKTDTLRIGLLKPPRGVFQTKRWSAEVYNGILQAAFHSSRPCEVVPIPMAEEPGEEDDRRTLAECAKADGLILFSFEKSRAVCQRAGKWIVDINPPAVSATANFVSFDYNGASLALGIAWRRAGRKRVLFLYTGHIEEGVSNALRRFGLETGLHMHLDPEISLQFAEVSDVTEDRGYEAVQQLLSRGEFHPDAVYCAGDLLALGAIKALQEHGLRIPDDVSVVGGSGLDLSHTLHPGLTRTHGSFVEMGENLLAMLGQRVEGNGLSLPGRVLPMSFVGGATTRPTENILLGLSATGVSNS